MLLFSVRIFFIYYKSVWNGVDLISYQNTTVEQGQESHYSQPSNLSSALDFAAFHYSREIKPRAHNFQPCS